MIAYEDIELSAALRERLSEFAANVDRFRQEGPLDDVSVAKLEEHFKASHVYHSAGIEGNRLTMQETIVVLKEGIDISGKPLADTLEVRSLGAAYECLRTLAKSGERVTQVDIRSLHSLVVGDDPNLPDGAYRQIGVIISGAEYRPPEPLEVPARMADLVEWVNEPTKRHPVVVAAVAHHELVAIHPFADGNGRVSRLLMNLLLMRSGLPICNIRREDRAAYYEALAYADEGLYEDLVELVLSRCSDLFSEYVRIRTETKRMAEWAQKWGSKAEGVLLRREQREMELWQSRINQVFLEFQNAAEMLSDGLEGKLAVTFYDYRNQITFERYQQLLDSGRIPQSSYAFTIRFVDLLNDREERFLFRYFRNFDKFSREDKVIPLELNYFDQATHRWVRMSELPWASRIRIRELYFASNGQFVARYFSVEQGQETVTDKCTIAQIVQWFYDDVLENVFGLRES